MPAINITGAAKVRVVGVAADAPPPIQSGAGAVSPRAVAYARLAHDVAASESSRDLRVTGSRGGDSHRRQASVFVKSKAMHSVPIFVSRSISENIKVSRRY